MAHIVRILAVAALVSTMGCASSTDPARMAAAAVRITGNVEAVRGCESVGVVTDYDWDDVQKRAAQLGGNVALLMQQEPGRAPFRGVVTFKTAEVYRCP